MKYGNLRITNMTPEPVQIYVGDKMIEDVCFLETGEPENLSTLAGGGSYTFVLPIIGEGVTDADFILSAKHLTNGSTIETTTIKVLVDGEVEWIVDGEVDTVPEVPEGE
jgi:hypothetical protein